jgi:hypothetical protein
MCYFAWDFISWRLILELFLTAMTRQDNGKRPTKFHFYSSWKMRRIILGLGWIHIISKIHATCEISIIAELEENLKALFDDAETMPVCYVVCRDGQLKCKGTCNRNTNTTDSRM